MHIQQLPTKALRTLALNLSQHDKLPKTPISDAVRKLPRGGKRGLTISAATAAVIDIATDIRKAREARNKIRNRRSPNLSPKAWKRRELARRLAIPLAERLHNRRTSTVQLIARQCFRAGAAGGHSMTVTLTNDPTQIGYTVTMGKNWTTYRGRFKGWAANEDHHTVTVPTNWLTRVYNKRLAVLDGLMTLDAAPCDGGGEAELWAAVFAEQGRGYDVKVTRGYIARLDGVTYHAKTRSGALRGVKHKARMMADRAADVAEQERRSKARLKAFVARYGSIQGSVSIEDARAVGACEFGIRSWCHATGLPYERGHASFAEVVAAYATDPRPEARAAIIRAAHRASASQIAI